MTINASDIDYTDTHAILKRNLFYETIVNLFWALRSNTSKACYFVLNLRKHALGTLREKVSELTFPQIMKLVDCLERKIFLFFKHSFSA